MPQRGAAVAEQGVDIDDSLRDDQGMRSRFAFSATLLLSALSACGSEADAGTTVAEEVAPSMPDVDPTPSEACGPDDRAVIRGPVDLPCGHCDTRACTLECVQTHTGISLSCSECVVDQVACIQMHCSCGGSSAFAEAKCQICLASSGCRESFAQCAGIPFEPIGPPTPWVCSELLDCTAGCAEAQFLACAGDCATQGLPESESLVPFMALTQCISDVCAATGTGDGACVGNALLGECGLESKVCLNGPLCQPQCADKQCGPDGCGDVCGHCGPGKLCSAAGACETPEVTCSEIAHTGTCTGDVLLACPDPGGSLQVTDCTLTGTSCGFDERTGRFGCLPRTP